MANMRETTPSSSLKAASLHSATEEETLEAAANARRSPLGLTREEFKALLSYGKNK